MTEEETLNYSIQSKKIWFKGVWAWQGRLLCEQAGVSQVFEVIDTASFGFGGLGLVKFWSPGICWFDVFIILNFGLDLNILNLRSDFSTSKLNMMLVFDSTYGSPLNKKTVKISARRVIKCFSSESSWKPKIQPKDSRAAVWLSFWFLTRPSENRVTN